MLLEVEIDKLHLKIEDLERQNQALVQENLNTWGFIKNFPSMMCLLSPSKEIIYINRELEDFVGKSTSEINENFVLNNIHPENKKEFSDTISSVFLTMSPLDLEFRIQNKHKQFVWINGIGNPLYNHNKKLAGYLCIGYNITKSKKNQQQLSELDSSNKRLFSIIAHDLRNAFNSTLGFGELLAEDSHKLEIPKIKTVGKHIQTISNKTLILLENLLEWGQLQNTLNTFFPKKVNIKDICKTITRNIPILNYSYPDRIKISASTDTMAFADLNMLQTIFRNLLNNALKFSPHNSTVTISCKREGSKTIISIKDQGIGISPENISNLFNIRKKQSSLGINGEKGTGLGLIICKEFILKNGGNIWIKSTEGTGTEFLFSLPNNKSLTPN